MTLKKIILSILFCMSVIATNAQMQGFGNLKIGMSISSIPELSNAEKITTIRELLKNEGLRPVELVADSLMEISYNRVGSYYPGVRIFIVPSMNITPEIILKNIKLSFINDSLYAISVDPSDNLIEALTFKYGEPKKTAKEENKEYVNGYGRTIIKVDRRFVSEWIIKGTTCNYLVSVFHDSKGEPIYTSYVLLYINDIYLKISEYDKELQNLIRKRSKDRQVKKLASDF